MQRRRRLQVELQQLAAVANITHAMTKALQVSVNVIVPLPLPLPLPLPGTLIRGLSSTSKCDQLGENLGRLYIYRHQLSAGDGFGGFDERSGDYRLLGLQSQLRYYSLAFAVGTHLTDRVMRY